MADPSDHWSQNCNIEFSVNLSTKQRSLLVSFYLHHTQSQVVDNYLTMQVGFELGSSESKATTLTTGPNIVLQYVGRSIHIFLLELKILILTDGHHAILLRSLYLFTAEWCLEVTTTTAIITIKGISRTLLLLRFSRS